MAEEALFLWCGAILMVIARSLDILPEAWIHEEPSLFFLGHVYFTFYLELLLLLNACKNPSGARPGSIEY